MKERLILKFGYKVKYYQDPKTKGQCVSLISPYLFAKVVAEEIQSKIFC